MLRATRRTCPELANRNEAPIDMADHTRRSSRVSEHAIPNEPEPSDPTWLDQIINERSACHNATTTSPIRADVNPRTLGEGTQPDGWPKLEDVAFHGIVGETAMAAAPYTEADPVALLIQLLIAAGCSINSGPHLKAGNDKHPTRLFGILVGRTSGGGKGTSWAVVRALQERFDPDLRRQSGFGSGEVLIDSLAEPADGENVGHDTRLLLHETEFARMLKAASRDGSILSMVVRNAWDGEVLQARSRNKTTIATNHHLSVIGHITPDELRRALTETESFNGFANRFLFALTARSQLLPEGGNVPADIVTRYGDLLAHNIRKARLKGQLERVPAATKPWAELYHQLAEDQPGGLLEAVTGRAIPQTLRLSLVYALLDGADSVQPDHIAAAAALWAYCRASARYIFGDAEGDANTQKLLDAIRLAGPDGLDATTQSTLFNRNLTAKHIQVLRTTLEQAGKIVTITQDTGGRPKLISYHPKHRPT